MSERARARPELAVIQGGREQSEPVAASDRWPIMGYCASPDIRPGFRVVDTEDKLGVLAAQTVCELCIVRERCLEFGLNLPERIDFGIWGGTTPEQRIALRAARERDGMGSPGA